MILDTHKFPFTWPVCSISNDSDFFSSAACKMLVNACEITGLTLNVQSVIFAITAEILARSLANVCRE